MVAATCVLFLSACGIKGPLYLPSVDPVPADTSSDNVPSTDSDSPATDALE
ncbi:MAG: lipoprotein [Betaproteobacteria bacterium]|nr:lipoprotein [Betaproteobacteria bacterium]